MKITTILLLHAILFCILSVPFFVRGYARTLADEILHYHCPASVKLITMCDTILSWFNKWITYHPDQDMFRVLQLRYMLKEMQNLHG